MSDQKLYWVRRDGNLGRSIKYGDEVKNLDPQTMTALKAKGFISNEKPDSVSSAAKGSISALEQANAELTVMVSELESEVSGLEAKNKGLIKDLNDPQVKARKTKEKIKALEEKIADLEKQLEEATAPGGE